MGSCKKEFNEEPDNSNLKYETYPEECVLKEPFLVYLNTHQEIGVAIHTSINVDGTSDKKCFIRYKYSDKGEDSWSDYHMMSHHKFESKGYTYSSFVLSLTTFVEPSKV